MQGAVAIAVALITVGIPAAVQVHRLRKENTAQHKTSAGLLEENAGMLAELRDDMREVRTNLAEHINWHAHHAGHVHPARHDERGPNQGETGVTP